MSLIGLLFWPKCQDSSFFYSMLISDLLARSAVTSYNHKLRTKPFKRPPDQVVRTWSWSVGRQNTPLLCAESLKRDKIKTICLQMSGVQYC